jgi:hypothetical protein
MHFSSLMERGRKEAPLFKILLCTMKEKHGEHTYSCLLESKARSRDFGQGMGILSLGSLSHSSLRQQVMTSNGGRKQIAAN